jgi:hypothetical protein
MAKTVNEAFNLFLRDYVNLDPTETQTARDSRDWLLKQIRSFPSKDENFPNLYTDKDIYFGSFARRTKKRELDDIDIMICLSAEGAMYIENSQTIEINVPESSYKLKKLCFDGKNTLSSRKIINKFISLLNKVSQYEKADIKRNCEAATLKLSTHLWTFDLVPCFFTAKNWQDRNFYLIPDGNGNWKKTDPRIDRQKVADANQKNNGNLLNIIRIMKYWNRRSTMPSMQSYLLENLILDYYSKRNSPTHSWVKFEIPLILNYIYQNIFNPVEDPKGIQGNINYLTHEQKQKIKDRAFSDFSKSIAAYEFDKNDEPENSILKWQEIFGSNFPDYL